MKRAEFRRKRPGGFTLMEMLIVLAILGLLLAMVGPRLLKSGKQADISTTKSQIKLLQACLDHFYLDMKEYPATDQGLESLVAGTAGAEATTASRWKGPYTKTGELPLDPWGNEYQYRYPPENSRADLPEIWSYGPDGQDNTEDDVVSWTTSKGEGEEGFDDLGTGPELGPEPEPMREDSRLGR